LRSGQLRREFSLDAELAPCTYFSQCTQPHRHTRNNSLGRAFRIILRPRIDSELKPERARKESSTEDNGICAIRPALFAADTIDKTGNH
jgi:hypothetical protein